MGHLVSYYPARGFYYYDWSKDIMCGFKSIAVEERKDELILHAYFMKEVYDYELNNDGILIKCEPVYQEAHFRLNVLVNGIDASHIEKKTSVYAGLHVSPILIEDEDGRKPMFYDLFSTYFVCFKIADILFYDGYYISVSQLTIPNEEQLKQFTSLAELLPDYVYNFVLSNNRLLINKARKYQKEVG